MTTKTDRDGNYHDDELARCLSELRTQYSTLEKEKRATDELLTEARFKLAQTAHLHTILLADRATWDTQIALDAAWNARLPAPLDIDDTPRPRQKSERRLFKFSRRNEHQYDLAAAAEATRNADRARDERQWEKAVDLYRTALQFAPDNCAIIVQYGHALKESGDVARAVTAYRAALRIAPSNPDTHLQLGHALKLQGRKGAATEAYLTALSLDPDLQDARDELIRYGWQVSDIDRVLQVERANQKDIPNAKSTNIVVRLLYPGSWADVESQPTIVVECSPPSKTAHLIVNWIRLTDSEYHKKARPIAAVVMQASDSAGSMWHGRCPVALEGGAYLIEILDGRTDTRMTSAGIRVAVPRALQETFPAIVTPKDWAVVSSRPAIEVRLANIADTRVEFVQWQTFSSAGEASSPFCTAFAKYDPYHGLHRLTCPVDLMDGPHAVLIRDEQNKILALCGIQVDGYLTFRQSYDIWTKAQLDIFEEERPLLAQHITTMKSRPHFIVLIENYTGASVKETILSLESQVYSAWTSHLVESEEWPVPAHLPAGDYLVVVRAGDILHPRMLYEFANRLWMQPDLDLIYADEDRRLPSGVHDAPFHKPGWSPDYLEAYNYVGYPVCVRRAPDEGKMFGNGYYGFILRYTEQCQAVAAIRKVLYHRCEASLVKNTREKTLELEALAGRLKRTGRTGEVRPIAGQSIGYEIRLDLASSPLVSIVIPTAGKKIDYKGKPIDFLSNCLSSIFHRSSYRNFELIVVDNGDLALDQKIEATRLGGKLLTFKEPVFNIAKKLNQGVCEAKGDFVLLLNDDIEVLSPDWIERMLEHFEKQHVGIVGAKLCYPDNTIQHAGVVHNYGNPDHAARGVDRNCLGYYGSIACVHNYSAVTGAVMLVRRELYLRVGGYTEVLAESFNDVDFCQKVRKLGYTIVYTPHAELIHFESQSRVPRLVESELDYYQSTWAAEVTIDPFYNEERLAVAPPTFLPSVNRPII